MLIPAVRQKNLKFTFDTAVRSPFFAMTCKTAPSTCRENPTEYNRALRRTSEEQDAGTMGMLQTSLEFMRNLMGENHVHWPLIDRLGIVIGEKDWEK
jgi:hypothetical protein